VGLRLLQQWCHAFFSETPLVSPSRRSLLVYRSLLKSRSIRLIPWSQLCISGHVDATALLPAARRVALTLVTHRDDAVDGGPCTQSFNNRALLSLSLVKVASSTSTQKPPTTYTQVNDFGPHTNSIFRGRLICLQVCTKTRDGELPSQEWRRACGWPSTTWTHQMCRYTDVTATEALLLAEDRPFWQMIAMARGFGWTLCVTTMMMMT